MDERKIWRLGIRSQRLPAIRRTISSSDESAKVSFPGENPFGGLTAEEQLNQKSVGYGVTGCNLKTIRPMDAAKSSVKVIMGSSKFAQSSKVPILLDIPTGIQVTPVARLTKSSNKRSALTSTKSRTYYHRPEYTAHAQRNCDENGNAREMADTSRQITASALMNKIPSDTVSAGDHGSVTDCTSAQPKKNSTCKESSGSFFQLNTINLNNEFSKVAANCSGSLALNEALSRKHMAGYCASQKSPSSFHPYSRNQATLTVNYLPLREVYLKATGMEGAGAQQVAEEDKDCRIRKWLKTLNYFDGLPQSS